MGLSAPSMTCRIGCERFRSHGSMLDMATITFIQKYESNSWEYSVCTQFHAPPVLISQTVKFKCRVWGSIGGMYSIRESVSLNISTLKFLKCVEYAHSSRQYSISRGSSRTTTATSVVRKSVSRMSMRAPMQQQQLHARERFGVSSARVGFDTSDSVSFGNVVPSSHPAKTPHVPHALRYSFITQAGLNLT